MGIYQRITQILHGSRRSGGRRRIAQILHGSRRSGGHAPKDHADPPRITQIRWAPKDLADPPRIAQIRRAPKDLADPPRITQIRRAPKDHADPPRITQIRWAPKDHADPARITQIRRGATYYWITQIPLIDHADPWVSVNRCHADTYMARTSRRCQMRSTHIYIYYIHISRCEARKKQKHGLCAHTGYAPRSTLDCRQKRQRKCSMYITIYNTGMPPCD